MGLEEMLIVVRKMEEMVMSVTVVMVLMVMVGNGGTVVCG